MTTTSDHFDRVAKTVAERTSTLFSASTAVVNSYGAVVAASALGCDVNSVVFKPEQDDVALRLAMQIDAQAGEVLVSRSDEACAASPRLAQVLIDLIVAQAAVVSRLPYKHESKNKLVHDLLHGSRTDMAALTREAHILGMDLSRPRAVILIDAGAYLQRGALDPLRTRGGDEETLRRVQVVIGSIVSFFNLPDDTICAYIGENEIAVLKASSSQDLSAWTNGEERAGVGTSSWADLGALKRAAQALVRQLQRETGAAMSIGLGRYHPGIEGLARSYQDARAALSLGRRFREGESLHCLDSLGIAAFVGVADERTKVELAMHLLSPLDQDPDLLATLRTYFAQDCSASETARALSVHRNTLGYRFDKIALLTGLDPRRFDDAVQIRIALILRTLS